MFSTLNSFSSWLLKLSSNLRRNSNILIPSASWVGKLKLFSILWKWQTLRVFSSDRCWGRIPAAKFSKKCWERRQCPPPKQIFCSFQVLWDSRRKTRINQLSQMKAKVISFLNTESLSIDSTYQRHLSLYVIFSDHSSSWHRTQHRGHFGDKKTPSLAPKQIGHCNKIFSSVIIHANVNKFWNTISQTVPTGENAVRNFRIADWT